MTSRMALAAACAAAAVMAAGQAQAAATVLSNGMAKICSEFAKDGRDDVGAIESCDLALTTEALDRQANSFPSRAWKAFGRRG